MYFSGTRSHVASLCPLKPPMRTHGSITAGLFYLQRYTPKMSTMNFTGEWTLENNDNLESYLEALGKCWLILPVYRTIEW